MNENSKELNEEKLKEFAERMEGSKNETQISRVGAQIQDTSNVQKPWEKTPEQIQFSNQLGWQQLKIKDLPTQGLFYPEETEILIRAATAGEIRHWSTLTEDNLSALDDMLNYIIERCAKIKFPTIHSSWKDIKEVDRFYVLLAIRELTFVNGENKLQVKTSETSKIDVTKDMIDYINFDERLMRSYSAEERKIVLNFKSGKRLKVTIPSVGITNWLKLYINRKRQMNEVIDEDFISFAPFVLLDWRGLNDDTYSKIILDSHNWSAAEISMLTEIRKIFMDTIDPVVRYRDEEGGERTVPLSFQGGIKSIFLISDPFGELV
jgi:hypothetical protein